VNALSFCSQVFLYCEHSIIFSFSHFRTFPDQAIRPRDQYRRLPSGSTSACKYSLNISGLTLHFTRYCFPQALFLVDCVCRRHQKYLNYDVWFVGTGFNPCWNEAIGRYIYQISPSCSSDRDKVLWDDSEIFSACTRWGYSDVNFYSLWINIIMNNEMCSLKSAWFALKSQEGSRC
jgi:hypothetical protein